MVFDVQLVHFTTCNGDDMGVFDRWAFLRVHVKIDVFNDRLNVANCAMSLDGPEDRMKRRHMESRRHVAKTY